MFATLKERTIEKTIERAMERIIDIRIERIIARIITSPEPRASSLEPPASASIPYGKTHKIELYKIPN